MKRILPLVVLPLSLLAVAAACSSSSDNNNNSDGGTSGTSGGTSGTVEGEGGAPPGAIGDKGVNPIDGAKAEPFTSPTIGNLSSFLDGPTWSPAQKVYLFSAPEQTEGFVFRLKEDGVVGPTRGRPGEANPLKTVGQAIDIVTGDVISVSQKAVNRTPVTPSALTDPASVATICTGYDVATNPPSTDEFDPTKVPPPGTGQFDALNDIVLHSKGHMYFTDPGYGLTPETNRVFFLPAGATVAKIVGSYPELDHPNGIALSADEKSLYVGFATPHPPETPPFIGKFAIADDGNIDNKVAPAKFITLAAGVKPDGMATDTAGNLYVALDASVAVYKDTGEPWGVIEVPVAGGQTVTGVTFGGENLSTLFITTGGESGVGLLFRVNVKVKGNPQ